LEVRLPAGLFKISGTNTQQQQQGLSLDIIRLKNQREFEDYLLNSPVHAERLRFEKSLMESWQELDSYELEGFCIACESKSHLLVDKLYGSQQLECGWLPNWRERLVCPSCELNNRQRAMIHVLKQAMAGRNEGEDTLALYAMEQVTSFFTWLKANLPFECVGSEYLGEETNNDDPFHHARSGTGHPQSSIRHENAEALSFKANRFDFVVSNDVMEHVNEPRAVIAEMMRVLKPRGELFLSIPFCQDRARSERRATAVGGKLKHYLPEQYHGNPLSPKGSLVFYDFGWDFLTWLRTAGFRKVRMCLYWSDRYGYLGDPQFYFHAVKSI
jgi:SAM-dependent methyltransferase